MKDFEEVFGYLKEYKGQYGDCIVPQQYITKDGVCLGKIVHSIRVGNRRASSEEKKILNNLGFVWNVKTEKRNLITN